MSSHQTPMQTTVVETRSILVDPTALGVFGLAIITFVAASQKMGWTTGFGNLVPWAIFLGAGAQVLASMFDFKKNNYFGAIVLGTYGLFWFAVAMTWAINLGWFGEIDAAKLDPKQTGFAFLGYFIFSLFIMVAAFETNKAFAIILVLINFLLLSLALAAFKVTFLGISPENFSLIAACSEFAISLVGFYAAGAIFLNNFFGRPVLPLGAPMGWIRKGPK